MFLILWNAKVILWVYLTAKNAKEITRSFLHVALYVWWLVFLTTKDTKDRQGFFRGLGRLFLIKKSIPLITVKPVVISGMLLYFCVLK